jgi:hypothetical protein
MEMPLSAVEIVYQVLLDSIVDPDVISSQMDEEDQFSSLHGPLHHLSHMISSMILYLRMNPL